MRSFLILNFLIIYSLYSENNYVTYKTKRGDGIQKIFSQYNIPYNNLSVDLFIKINLLADSKLLLHKTYLLPIEIYKFNNKNIRSSIGTSDYNYAKKIQDYNLEMAAKGLKENFKKDKILWKPLFLDFNPIIPSFSQDNSKKLNERYFPIFGKEYEKFNETSKKLSNTCFYLISGHGGPDPGAQSEVNGNILSEDEYAYDVILRLGRKLAENGAGVYIILQDPNDGIRNETYLSNSNDEFFYGGKTVSLSQKERLKEGTSILNSLYQENLSNYENHHAVSIHVDSRHTGSQQIDIFFYYKENSEKGQSAAKVLLSTIEKKYKLAQPNRGYQGTLKSRNLYIVRNTKPTITFIELGNIQNYKDQQRILIPDNRQAIANWLCDGFIRIYGK